MSTYAKKTKKPGKVIERSRDVTPRSKVEKSKGCPRSPCATKSDPSKFWKQMNLILPKKAKLGINLVDEDNNAVDLNDVANYINEYLLTLDLN